MDTLLLSFPSKLSARVLQTWAWPWYFVLLPNDPLGLRPRQLTSFRWPVAVMGRTQLCNVPVSSLHQGTAAAAKSGDTLFPSFPFSHLSFYTSFKMSDQAVPPVWGAGHIVWVLQSKSSCVWSDGLCLPPGCHPARTQLERKDKDETLLGAELENPGEQKIGVLGMQFPPVRFCWMGVGVVLFF